MRCLTKQGADIKQTNKTPANTMLDATDLLLIISGVSMD